MNRSVLFVCVKNAARSQMAEAFLRLRARTSSRRRAPASSPVSWIRLRLPPCAKLGSTSR
jgi:Low molecular weight phosphotyrosine protein phosphatase